jgi:hypothetical protein
LNTGDLWVGSGEDDEATDVATPPHRRNHPSAKTPDGPRDGLHADPYGIP